MRPDPTPFSSPLHHLRRLAGGAQRGPDALWADLGRHTAVMLAVMLAVVLAGSQAAVAQVPAAGGVADTTSRRAPGPSIQRAVQTQDSGFTIAIEKLPPPINTDEYDEISPVVSRDGLLLYFTRTGSPDFNRQLLIGGTDAADSLGAAGYRALLREVYAELGEGGLSLEQTHRSRFNQDIWEATFDRAGQLVHVGHPDTPLNNALPNALAARMPETGHYVTLNQFPERGGMRKGFSHVYRRRDGSWSRPVAIDIDEYYTYSEGVGATLSEDGEVMILAIQRADGFGATDLYVSRRVDSLRWSAPVNLGGGINTSFRESTPSLSEDKLTLYFSSNRWGRGGNDIYFCRRLDTTWTNWSVARRFKPPISSELDDSQPFFNEATGYLYLASRRDGTSDIYRVRIQPPRPISVLIVGRVLDARTREPLEATLQMTPRGASGEDTTMLAVGGRFEYRARDLRDLNFYATHEGYLGQGKTVAIRRPDEAPAYEIEILLDVAERGGTITLDPIYFQQSLAAVKPESLPQLERLRDVLAANPGVYVRIEGHTDNQGTPASLERLSRERAEAIRDYLVAKGIDRLRVQAAGFGAKRPVADNTTDQGRQTNRRVEVVITRIIPPRAAGPRPTGAGGRAAKATDDDAGR